MSDPMSDPMSDKEKLLQARIDELEGMGRLVTEKLKELIFTAAGLEVGLEQITINQRQYSIACNELWNGGKYPNVISMHERGRFHLYGVEIIMGGQP